MPGYLKSSLTLAQARDVVQNRFAASDTTILSSDNPPRFSSLQMVFLYSAPSAGKKLTFVKSQRNDARKTRVMEIEKYHRFVLLAHRNTETVFGLFTENTADSHHLFRYHSQLKPGCIVEVLNAKIVGVMKATNTSLISTIEPIIPVPQLDAVNINLPHSLEIAEFRYFEFSTRTLRILSATATENICPGYFCDGQTCLQNCGCLAVSSKRIWALTVTINYDELRPLEEVEDANITSTALTEIFVTAGRQEMSPNATDFDTFLLDDAVTGMSRLINNNGGFTIRGWFKPSQSEDGATRDIKRNHLCSIVPVNALTEDIIALKY